MSKGEQPQALGQSICDALDPGRGDLSFGEFSQLGA
jgi:hypothetical protein